MRVHDKRCRRGKARGVTHTVFAAFGRAADHRAFTVGAEPSDEPGVNRRYSGIDHEERPMAVNRQTIGRQVGWPFQQISSHGGNHPIGRDLADIAGVPGAGRRRMAPAVHYIEVTLTIRRDRGKRAKPCACAASVLHRRRIGTARDWPPCSIGVSPVDFCAVAGREDRPGGVGRHCPGLEKLARVIRQIDRRAGRRNLREEIRRRQRSREEDIPSAVGG